MIGRETGSLNKIKKEVDKSSLYNLSTQNHLLLVVVVLGVTKITTPISANSRNQKSNGSICGAISNQNAKSMVQ